MNSNVAPMGKDNKPATIIDKSDWRFAGDCRTLGEMYDDIDRILIHATTILSRIDEIAAEITKDYRGKDLTMIAVLNGAIMFTADLLRRIPLPLQLDCLSVASYHSGTVSSGVVTFDQLSMPEIRGRHVLIVDDILDSGQTLHAICEKLKNEMDPADVETCVLLSKRKQRFKEIRVRYVGFEIEDEFVVGYGLDYNQRYRNLPFIGVPKPELLALLPQRRVAGKPAQ